MGKQALVHLLCTVNLSSLTCQICKDTHVLFPLSAKPLTLLGLCPTATQKDTEQVEKAQ